VLIFCEYKKANCTSGECSATNKNVQVVYSYCINAKSPIVKIQRGFWFNRQLLTVNRKLPTTYLTINTIGLLHLLMPLVPRVRI
jgi:hypothetical protein